MKFVDTVLAKGNQYITSYRGWRTLRGKKQFHKDIDIISNLHIADQIISLDVGIVTTVAVDSQRGVYVQIVHTKYPNGNPMWLSHYQHLKRGSVIVKKGQRVKDRQPIATMGATGNVTGMHLDFGIIYIDPKGNATRVDPLPYLTGQKKMKVNV